MDVVEKYGVAVFFLLPFCFLVSFVPANQGGKLNALPASWLERGSQQEQISCVDKNANNAS